MKIKTFTHGEKGLGNTEPSFPKLEKVVNEWLAANPAIRVLKMSNSFWHGKNILEEYFINCTVVILYEDSPII